MKLSAFEDLFLEVDEDGDKVFKAMPCPFLGDDNLCSIYDVRPKACREFPHTDRKKIYQINNLTIKILLLVQRHTFCGKIEITYREIITQRKYHKNIDNLLLFGYPSK